MAKLEVQLDCGDRQVLSGFITRLSLEAHQVIYQGLHLSHLQLTAQDIQINIGQVLKGKALQLIAPLPVEVTVQLSPDDVQSSLHSGLLQDALIDALLTLIGEQIEDALGGNLRSQTLALQAPQIQLSESHLQLSTQLWDQVRKAAVPISLKTGLVLARPNALMLLHPEWLPTPNAKRGLPLQDLHGHCFDLGDEAQLKSFILSTEGISAHGQLLVLPATNAEQEHPVRNSLNQ